MERRKFLRLAIGGFGVALAHYFTLGKAFAAEVIDQMNLSEDEWKKKLTPLQYDILRTHGTERAFTSELLNEHRDGIFACAGCDLPLFSSHAKFDSGTGWPSFYLALEGHVETTTDYTLLAPRTEYHCARCGGHHGHLFNDGPQPTGLRYCSNGAVLKFIPEEPEAKK